MSLKAGANCMVHESVITYGRCRVGHHGIILENVILGYPTADNLLAMRDQKTDPRQFDYAGTRIGSHATIRSEGVFYKNTVIGDSVRTGHKILVRENCRIGSHVLIGTNVVIDNNVTIGSHVSIQSSVYIPTGTVIGDFVFLGPNVVITNDPVPVRTGSCLDPVRLGRGATIGGNATLCPGITVGEGAFVAAGAIVTRDVPAWHLAIGGPARFKPLSKQMKVRNKIL